MEDESITISMTSEDSYKSDLDNISQRLYALTKENQSIERRLKDFEKLEHTERFSLRESLQENAQLSVQLQNILVDFDKKYLRVKGVAKKIKTAHENSLQALNKERKKLKTLDTQIIFKERELLGKYRQTQEFQRMNDPEPEQEHLLEHEYDNSYTASGGYEESKGEVQKGNEASQDFLMRQQDELEEDRQKKILEVCDSLDNVFYKQTNR